MTYERNGIELRVIPLFPAQEDRDLFARIADESVFVERAELLRNTTVRETLTLVGSSPWCARRGRRGPARAPGPQRALVRTSYVGEGRMSRHAWLRPVAGSVAVVALIAGAALLVALAADVLRFDRQLRDGDAAYAARAEATWEPDTLLPRGITSSLLGVGDDVAFRRAVDQFWRSEPRGPDPRVRGRHAPKRGRAKAGSDRRRRGKPRAPLRPRDAPRHAPPRGGPQLADPEAGLRAPRDRAAQARDDARPGATTPPPTISSSR